MITFKKTENPDNTTECVPVYNGKLCIGRIERARIDGTWHAWCADVTISDVTGVCISPNMNINRMKAQIRKDYSTRNKPHPDDGWPFEKSWADVRAGK